MAYLGTSKYKFAAKLGYQTLLGNNLGALRRRAKKHWNIGNKYEDGRVVEYFRQSASSPGNWDEVPTSNPGATIRGWVKARAVKIVRNKRGQAVKVQIKT